MARTAKARLEAISGAIAARDAFLARVERADGGLEDAARLMAEAIDMHFAANGLEIVGHDGRATVCVEDISASHCLKAAREAYGQCEYGEAALRAAAE